MPQMTSAPTGVTSRREPKSRHGHGDPWCVILAAGEGKRLRSLTTFEGRAVPKQYCAIGGGVSLLGLALDRARRLVPDDRIVVIVDAEHQPWWCHELAEIPPENIVVQPGNRGTAAGLLLPALRIAAHNPQASVVFLPSDHFVADEWTLSTAVLSALAEVERDPERLYLLGVAPDPRERREAAGSEYSDLGWIMPSHRCDLFGASPVDSFHEKPRQADVPWLLARGAVANTFILAANLSALMASFAEALPELLDFFVRHAAAKARPARLAALYGELSVHDFSTEVLEKVSERLALVRVPACGWNDLGTPERVLRCLEQMGTVHRSARLVRPPARRRPAVA